MITVWDLTRATGFVGLALLSLSVLLGAFTSARVWFAVELHRQASVLGLVLCTLHGALAATSPWLARTEPASLGAGVLSLALMWWAAAAFASRRALGARAWRVLHLVAYASLVAALAHGFTSGTSSPLVPARLVYLAVAVAGVFVATLRPLLGPPLPAP